MASLVTDLFSTDAASAHSLAYSETVHSAYIHIPFCRRRCYYCDFPVSVVGDKPPLGQGERFTGSNSGTIAHYVDMLCQEIEHTPVLGRSSLQTVFFGGGTPSLLSVEQLDRILTVLARRFGIETTAELSMEIDPGTFDRDQLQGYRTAGITRVSLGVQAFQPELLTLCGRSHTVQDIYDAIALIHQVQIPSFSLDLISGLPHQTLEQWQESLQQAISIAPNHLSTYDLTIEPITAFGRHYQPGISPLPSDDTAADMYRLAQRLLTAAGYQHYEISNYAQPGHQCRHNRVYWENRPFYGFGMGATSYLRGDRVSRPRKTREYYDWVSQHSSSVVDVQQMENVQPMENGSPASERLLDTLMVGLRLAEGISLDSLTQQFGQVWIDRVCDRLSPYQQEGWVEKTEHRIRLTDPEGFLFSNVILVSLFEEFS